MAKVSKRVAANKAKIERTKFYPIDEALGLVKGCASAKFDESIDVAVQLGIDAKKSDQVVRGSVVLPAGTGRPGSMPWVWALNALQNSMMFRPR